MHQFSLYGLQLLRSSALALCGALIACAQEQPTTAPGSAPLARADVGTRIIVGWASQAAAPSPEQLRAMEQASHARITYLRPLGNSMHVLELRPQPPTDTVQAIRQLQQMPGITSVEPDQKMKAH